MLMLRVAGLEERVTGTLERAGVIKHVHCIGSSDKHLNMFIDFEGVYDRPEFAEDVAFIIDQLAEGIVQSGLDPQVLLGPAEGGNTLAEHLGPVLALRLGHPVKVLKTKKSGKLDFTIDGDENDLKYLRTLLVDDISTSGGSAARVAKPALRFGAEIIGLVVVADRERLTLERLLVELGFDAQFYGCLVQVDTQSWKDKEECDQSGPCGHGQPLVPVNSHTRAYIAEHGQPVPRIGIDLMT